MLDQSLSKVNFWKIYQQEEKRGILFEPTFFPDIARVSNKIRKWKKIIKNLQEKKKLRKEVIERRLQQINEEIKKQKELRKELIWEAMSEIAKETNRKNFKIDIQEIQIKGQKLYTTDKSREVIFSMKVINSFIAKTFNVRHKNRDEIIPQIISLTDDKVAKYIVKGDIKKFFESINQEILMKKIFEESKINAVTRKIIKSVISGYNAASGETRGIPRGIGISSYLAEIFLKSFDEAMSNIPNVVFYTRYVDDFIIIITPNENIKENDLKKEIEDELSRLDLTLNKEKFAFYDLFSGSNNKKFEYLGYEFCLSGGKLRVSMSNNRLKKYSERIELAFNAYRNSKSKSYTTMKILIDRVKFLTSNTRLSNNKSNAFIGVYYSNKFINDLSCLDKIQEKILLEAEKTKNDKIIRITERINLKQNFLSKKYRKFTPSELNKITAGWNNA